MWGTNDHYSYQTLIDNFFDSSFVLVLVGGVDAGSLAVGGGVGVGVGQ